MVKGLQNGLGLGLAHLLSTPAGGGALTAPFSADFTTDTYVREGAASTFSDLFFFTGGGNRYYTDASGLLQLAGSGQPRTGHHRYDVATASYLPTFLFETDGRQNAFRYSDQFTQASYWQAQGSTIVANQSNGRGGTNTMDRVAETATTGLHGISTATLNQPATSAGTEYVTSYDVKVRGSTRYIQIVYSTTGWGASNYATFDFQTGTITAEVDGEATIEPVGPDIYRISYRCTATATIANGEYFVITSNVPTGRAPSFAGNTSNGFFIWGAQLEVGARFPSSYVPTTTTALSRATENLLVQNAKLPYNAAGMSFAMKGRTTYADDGTSVSVSGRAGNVVFYSLYNDAANYLEGVISTQAALDNLNFRQEALGVTDTSIIAYSGGTSGKIRSLRPMNIAGSHGPASIQGALDGTASVIDETPTAFPTAVSIRNLDVADIYFGEIDTFRIWPEALDEAALVEVTA